MTKSKNNFGNDLAAIFDAIQQIRARLDRLEGVVTMPQVGPLQEGHPSLDRLSVAEAIADGIFAGVTREKACQFEPDKPCDHCAMCSTRGF